MWGGFRTKGHAIAWLFAIKNEAANVDFMGAVTRYCKSAVAVLPATHLRRKHRPRRVIGRKHMLDP
jgi:hypothetical protein